MFEYNIIRSFFYGSGTIRLSFADNSSFETTETIVIPVSINNINYSSSGSADDEIVKSISSVNKNSCALPAVSSLITVLLKNSIEDDGLLIPYLHGHFSLINNGSNKPSSSNPYKSSKFPTYKPSIYTYGKIKSSSSSVCNLLHTLVSLDSLATALP